MKKNGSLRSVNVEAVFSKIKHRLYDKTTLFSLES